MSDVSLSSVSFHDAKESTSSLSTAKDADAFSMPELPGSIEPSGGSGNDQPYTKSGAPERRPSTIPIMKITSYNDTEQQSKDQVHTTATKETQPQGTDAGRSPATDSLEEPRDSRKSSHPSKKGFLERIGIHRRKRVNDDRDADRSKQDVPKTTISTAIDQDDNASDGSIDTSTSSASDLPRKSAESSRSVGLHSLANPRVKEGYVPHGGIPVKVKSKTKSSQELSRVYLAQTLHAISRDTQEEFGHFHGATWALKFSKDGKYLATAGQLCTVYIWKVLDSEEQRTESIKVFQDSIYREYQGHTADILDIAWSKNNFIASASMDKTIRLWHVSRGECLGIFRHPDVVPSVCFHPKDDRFFLSGSLDGRIRLWSVPDKKVAFWNEVPNGDMVTAVGMTLDGKTVCAGSHTGQCFIYETQGLKYNTQVTLRFSKRTSKKARKITGIEAMPGVPANDERILITSNDSRIRLINMRDKSLMFRYKGASNASMQIKASFSDDGRNIICGSDDGNVYIWLAEPISFSPLLALWRDSEVSLSAFDDQHSKPSSSHSHTRMQNWFRRHEKRVSNGKPWSHSEHFEAHEHAATCAIFAPSRTRQLLAKSGKDIIYNNTLINIRHKLKHDPTMRRSLSGNDFPDLVSLYHHHQPHQEDVSDTEEQEALFNQAKERHTYSEGPILVSANDSGCIKIWRVDSGWYRTEQKSRISHRKSNSLDHL